MFSETIFSYHTKFIYLCFNNNPTRMSLGETERLRYMLSTLHDDIVKGSVMHTKLEEKDTFIDHYEQISAERKHKTHTYVYIALDFERGGLWSEEGVVEMHFCSGSTKKIQLLFLTR